MIKFEAARKHGANIIGEMRKFYQSNFYIDLGKEDSLSKNPS